MARSLIPTLDRVLVRIDDDISKRLNSLLFLPEDARVKTERRMRQDNREIEGNTVYAYGESLRCTVVRVGTRTHDVKPGMRVLIPSRTGSFIRIKGVTFVMLREAEIYGILS